MPLDGVTLRVCHRFPARESRECSKRVLVMKVQDCVIGAGVVGLSVARSLALRGREVLVAEACHRAGEGISSRNSGVIHAGLYYPYNSLKGRLCVEGRKRLYEYCEQRGVGHMRCVVLS